MSTETTAAKPKRELKLGIHYKDRQGVMWGLLQVRPSPTVPNFVDALAGPDLTPISVHVDELRMHVAQ